MEEKINALTELLRQTGSAHHQAFLADNGADPDWSIWYADYLYDRLPEHLGVRLNKSDMIYILMHLNYEQKALAPGSDWARYYARSLLSRYG